MCPKKNSTKTLDEGQKSSMKTASNRFVSSKRTSNSKIHTITPCQHFNRVPSIISD